MRAFAACCALVIVAGTVAWSMGRRVALQGARGGDPGTGDAALSSQVADLRSEVAALRAELSHVRAAQARSFAQPSAAPVPRPPAPVDTEARDRETRHQVAALASRIAHRFVSERPDPEAAAAASAIGRALVGTALEKAADSVECAASMCKVDLVLASEDDRAQLADRVHDIAALHGEVFYQHHEGSPPRTTLFAARPGHSLPKLTP